MNIKTQYALPEDVQRTLRTGGWFDHPGAYVLVDGQFGSTGKGVAAAMLATFSATTFGHRIDTVVSNAGPNSGHTGILAPNGEGPQFTVINKQVPVATSMLGFFGEYAQTFLNGGAVIDPGTLAAEFGQLPSYLHGHFWVHSHAAVVRDEDREANSLMVQKIASTGKGTATAAAARLVRSGLVYREFLDLMPQPFWPLPEAHSAFVPHGCILVETSQGLSLGINSGFYPYCTHRECTVAQALSDARINPYDLQRVMMVVRTFPIRVGNTQGSSGPGFPDQEETSWEAIDQPPEFTTVTKRQRRIFTWSRTQFRDGLQVNRPDVIFLNFCNYLKPDELDQLIASMREDILAVWARQTNHPPPQLLLGFGPTTQDIRVRNLWGRE